jgi:hypothetical protein
MHGTDRPLDRSGRHPEIGELNAKCGDFSNGHERGSVPRRRITSVSLITMPYAIGDAIFIGLSAVDQITRNDSVGNVTIDILCNHLQAPLFEYDPRVVQK